MNKEEYLLDKISKSLYDICEVNHIRLLKAFDVVINQNSQIDEEVLCNYLENHNKNMISSDLKITIKNDDIEETTVIIYSLQGE